MQSKTPLFDESSLKGIEMINFFQPQRLTNTVSALLLLLQASVAYGNDYVPVVAEALDMQLYHCITDERSTWSVAGLAEFGGEPWTYIGTKTEAFDATRGEWVPIAPTTETILVPGQWLDIRFDDGSTFRYSERVTDSHLGLWDETLVAMMTVGMENLPPPYTVAKWADGEIVLLKALADGTCGLGWYIRQPD